MSSIVRSSRREAKSLVVCPGSLGVPEGEPSCEVDPQERPAERPGVEAGEMDPDLSGVDLLEWDRDLPGVEMGDMEPDARDLDGVRDLMSAGVGSGEHSSEVETVALTMFASK